MLHTMKYRLPELEVPSDNPFQHDALDRKPLVEFLASLIGRLEGPFVLALDSPWGTGKTTIVKMLQAKLAAGEFQCVYFNAWKVDYVTDPLVALVSALDDIQLTDSGAESAFRGHLKTVKKITSAVAKRAVVVGVKAATLGILDIDDEFEKMAADGVGEVAGNLVDAFQIEKQALEKFRLVVEKAVAQLKASGKKDTLVFFVDELDRCRPTFAIEMLERIKHLFDVPNIVFVLSVDKSQLEASTAAVYGERINAPEYLRRFIDLEYTLPLVRGKRFTEVLFKRFMLDEVFAKRTNSALKYDRQHFIEFFTLIADASQLSLRTRERCITRLRTVMDQTPDNHFLFSPLIALLIVLRAIQPDLFVRLKGGTATATDVMSYLSTLPQGAEIVESRSGVLLEIGLVLADENRERREKTLSALQAAAERAKANNEEGRATQLIGRIQYFQNFDSDGPQLGYLLEKIDLASGLQN
jgi:KAP family P-loop domain